MHKSADAADRCIISIELQPDCVTKQIMKAHQFLLLTLTCSLLTSCDIEPVSVGVWEVTIEAPQGSRDAIWTITSEPSLTISGSSGNRELQVEEIDLAGSRIVWSAEALDLPTAAEADRVNFRGTVDGNRLAGTVYTQQGNFTVNGTRRQ